MTEPTNTPKLKPLDLHNLLRHAFESGRLSNEHPVEGAVDAWVDYDPTENATYKRVLSVLGHFDEARPQPATASPVTVKPIKWTRIPSAYEMRSGKKKNWEARVDGVRIGQVEHPEDKAGYEERHRQRTLSYIQPEAPSKVD